MKNLVAVVLLALVCTGPALAGKPAAPSSDVADALKQIEQEFGYAIRDVDVDKLNQIIADDYRGVGSSGRPADKASVLEYVKSGKSRLEWFEIGPRDVKVLGDDVAVIQATVSEKRNEAGVTVNVSVIYMDVWVKRENRWVLVRTQTVKMK
jgi:ketosteroid isomerase-like protein